MEKRGKRAVAKGRLVSRKWAEKKKRVPKSWRRCDQLEDKNGTIVAVEGGIGAGVKQTGLEKKDATIQGGQRKD